MMSMTRHEAVPDDSGPGETKAKRYCRGSSRREVTLAPEAPTGQNCLPTSLRVIVGAGILCRETSRRKHRGGSSILFSRWESYAVLWSWHQELICPLFRLIISAGSLNITRCQAATRQHHYPHKSSAVEEILPEKPVYCAEQYSSSVMRHRLSVWKSRGPS